MRHNYSRICLALSLALLASSAQAQLVTFVPAESKTAYSSAAVVTTLTGVAGKKGSVDGSVTTALFAHPTGAALDANGVLYVADLDNHIIRKVALSGAVTTLAGAAGSRGSTDGPGAVARFYHPVAVAVGANGTLYVADADNHTIRKITAAGDVTTLAGSPGRKGYTDGAGAAARFNIPNGLAVDAGGVVYVADTFNHTIRKITPTGVVTTLAGSAGHKGSADGAGATARFYHPADVAVDAQGTVYVADNGNHTIRKVTTEGVVTTLAGTAEQSGYANGSGATARFHYPCNVGVAADGTLYVADHFNATIRKITATGEVTTLAGMVLRFRHVDGPGPEAQFEGPGGLAVGANGMLYVADGNTIRIVK